MVLKRKKQINKKNKLNLIFDDKERRSYLKGFHKRKEERRKKAQEKIEERIREEKLELRREHRKAVKDALYQHEKRLAEIASALRNTSTNKEEVHELPEHTVTITEICPSGSGLWLGHKKESSSEESDEESIPCEDEIDGMELRQPAEKVDLKEALKSSQAIQQRKKNLAKLESQRASKMSKKSKKRNKKRKLKTRQKK